MHGLGWPEVALILATILLIFGAGKLSQIGWAVGKSIREFRQSSMGKVTDVITPNHPVIIASVNQDKGLLVTEENLKDLNKAAVYPSVPTKKGTGEVLVTGRYGWFRRLLRRS